jgi:predicted NBD/HSP70 family sugar kinase
MLVVAILKRRIKQGKTYQDFRKAWYHTVGYGTDMKMYSAINAFDPREIIVIGMGEIKPGQDPMKMLQIEIKERLDHPLDAVIEPEIDRTFGIVVSEDDFSPSGKTKYKPASINGKETDFEEIAQALALAKKLITIATQERDEAKKRKSESKKD